MNLDDELRHALQRRDPPPGFERQVVTRVAKGDTLPPPARRPSWRRFALPFAASLLVMAGAGYLVHVRDQQQARDRWIAGARATNEVARALSIASEKVAAVQVTFQELNQHDQPNHP